MTKKPKILFIMAAFQVGGAEKQWAQYLSLPPDKDRYELEIITLMPSRSESVRQSFLDLGITLTHIDNPSMSKGKFLWELYRAIRRSNPSIIHTVLDGSTGSWGRLMGWLARVPYIMHSDRGIPAHSSSIHATLRPYLSKITTRFTPNAYALGDWIVSNGVPKEKIHVIPNVTDVNVRFHPENHHSIRKQWGIQDNELVVGFLAAFREEKRIDILLDALTKVPKEDRPDWVVLGGDGDKMPMVKEAIAADPWLSKHCKLLGLVEDTPSFYASIDYLVLTSEHEGTPNVVLEAQSMEKPIVSTLVSDMAMMLENCGITAEINDPASVGEAMAQMNRLSKQERQALGQYGRERVVKRHELHNAAEMFWQAHLDFLES
ncbi:MAG: Glycosyltransferase [uncultured Thiotrichaceae bacterium]|uniref:Glycosyltransferase n=1 Tax=uncultured Thiotrichaceae bacterium TaxID=298394 RepID=A0A6S6U6M3_9GAMM|nr:MAG: Glycosyltransferase [uncultured Thiotrichaceae bacterium]